MYNSYKLLFKACLQPGAGTPSNVLSVACLNSIMSPYILFSDSSKSVYLYDCSRASTHSQSPDSVIRTWSNAHTKAVSHISLFDYGAPFSPNSTPESPSYQHNLFMTIAPDSVIKLWDIRAREPSRSFTSHTYRSSLSRIRCSFSPCGRFIASGSEDSRGYVYDLRQGTLLQKLTGATDVVTDCLFHPFQPVIFTSSFDGRLRYYSF
jgi:WD40 repeat protein